jgi:predicted glycogen debranching enzyme
MGTISGMRTRRYHGLLVVSGDVPARRMMALASLDPVLTLDSGQVVRLATHAWASGSLAPTGHELLECVEMRDGVPTWRWRIGDVVLERTVAMRRGESCVAIMHRVVGGGPVELSLEPLCTWRDAHGERHEGDGLKVEQVSNGFVVENSYRIMGPGWHGEGEWYLGTFHREEGARGLNATEDLFRAGRFTQRLAQGETLEVRAWAGDLSAEPPPATAIIEAARARNRALVNGHAEPVLSLAADAFIVQTAAGPDVVAGYPWFGAWSRDTMISYPGLFLATGRVAEGRDLLRAYARTLSEGMLANTADTGQVEHNTADATLWFLHAVERHVTATGDLDLAADLVAPLDGIIDYHVKGTRYGIRVDPQDGLLTQGVEGYALSWMDAVIHGTAVTPRHGKAVELNALWINGLAALAALRQCVGRSYEDLEALRATAAASFARRFPSPNGWLHDVVDGPAGDDASLRPNQLLAFGLPYAPLRGADPGPVRAVGRQLLTPLGVRTLAPADPAYQGRHRGDPAGRDRAYHQGTVWPWLIGPYADAAEAVGLRPDGLFDGLRAHLDEWGVGSVSETADGDPPHEATGCPFQAWSVAELLRSVTRWT